MLKEIFVIGLMTALNLLVAGVIRDLAIDGHMFGVIVIMSLLVEFFGALFILSSLSPPEIRDRYFGPIVRYVFITFYLTMILFAGVTKWQNQIIGLAEGLDWSIGQALEGGFDLGKVESPMEYLVPTATAAESEDDCYDGYKYLINLAKQSGTEMRGVRSRYDSTKSVAETVESKAVAAVFVLENLSWDAFKDANKKTRADLVCGVLAAYSGEKGSHAFRDKQNGNFLGAAQISGGIYQSSRRLYLSAGLVQDSVSGRKNHLSAAKATRIKMDSARFEMSAKARGKIGSSTEWWNRVVIASHNFDSSSVSDVVANCGTSWRKAEGCKVQVSKPKKGKKPSFRNYKLPEETVHYLSMYADIDGGVNEVFKAFGQPNS